MRRVKPPVQLLINNLTSDEDHRQELWLHYISGNSPCTFEEKLNKIKEEHEKHDRFIKALDSLYDNPPTPQLISFLCNFSDFERSVMFLLLLGFSVEDVSKYKEISRIRIEQTIFSIKGHTAWKKYGIKT